MNKEIEFKTFEVKKNEWSSSRFVSETFNGNLEQDQVLLKIDRFALTTNNITIVNNTHQFIVNIYVLWPIPTMSLLEKIMICY